MNAINPASHSLARNLEVLNREFAWLDQYIAYRISQYINMDPQTKTLPPAAPTLRGKSQYELFVKDNRLKAVERLSLMLALAPHLAPGSLDSFLTRSETLGRPYPAWGGEIDAGVRGFMPTGHTACFLLGGGSPRGTVSHEYIFWDDHIFSKLGILKLRATEKNAPRLSGRIEVSSEFYASIVRGERYVPEMSPEFPAKLVETSMEWEDLILGQAAKTELEDIEDWLQHGKTLLDDFGMRKRIAPGHKCLFYGPPGTGKSLTACLLGKRSGRSVYKVDLSLTVSKYIGETEKNLGRLFDMASNKDWILFFDEADALFGKRTEMNSSNDRYGNQEVSYLLQRIEAHPGVVILASNLKDQIDPAFMRRFHTTIFFPLPGPSERLRIWQSVFSAQLPLASEVDLKRIADSFQLSGAQIVNAVRFASLQAVKKGLKEVSASFLEISIRREMQKIGIELMPDLD